MAVEDGRRRDCRVSGRADRRLLRMTKSERWLNLIAFLLNRHTAVAREELLS